MSYDANEAIKKMCESSYGRKGGNWVNNLLNELAKRPLIEEKDIRSHNQYANITPPRLYVLAVLAAGGSVAEMARQEGVPVSVVQDRLRAAKYVLKAKNATHAVAIAIREGLI